MAHGRGPTSLQVIAHKHAVPRQQLLPPSCLPASGGRSPWLTLSWTATASLHQIPRDAERFMAPLEQRYIEMGRGWAADIKIIKG